MQLIDRACQILTILSYQLDGMSVLELSEKINLAPSTTHRILTSLKENKMIVQDLDTKKYRIGYKIFSLCANLNERNTLITVAKPVMKKLSKSIDKTTVLCVMENTYIMNITCIEKEDSNLFLVKIGRELPLFSTSAGRVFCAFMDRGKVRSIYESVHEQAPTPYTKTNWDALCAEMDRVKENGYACIDEELQLGIKGYACPIFDINGKVIAALAFLSTKASLQDAEPMIRSLKESAKQISTEIG